MVAWYLDPALNTLCKQIRAERPAVQIGTIGDAAHAGTASDHNPEADGSVDAIDVMLGSGYTVADAERHVATLLRHRDYRIAYVIWNRRIISSTVQPWVWRTYTGSDPHTGHWHLSRNDVRESDASQWSGFYDLARAGTLTWDRFEAVMPRLHEGDDDAVLGGYDRIHMIQRQLKITDDGRWGPQTSAALGAREMTVTLWRRLFGLGG